MGVTEVGSGAPLPPIGPSPRRGRQSWGISEPGWGADPVKSRGSDPQLSSQHLEVLRLTVRLLTVSRHPVGDRATPHQPSEENNGADDSGERDDR